MGQPEIEIRGAPPYDSRNVESGPDDTGEVIEDGPVVSESRLSAGNSYRRLNLEGETARSVQEEF